MQIGQGSCKPNLVVIGHSLTIWPLYDLWPVGSFQNPLKCSVGWPRIMLTKFGSYRSFVDKLTSKWPLTCQCHFEIPSNVLRVGQGSWWPHLVGIGHSWTKWPLNDLWPVWSLQNSQKCIVAWPRIILTKFGGHRSFLNILTSTWPLTCRVNLKFLAMYCGLAKDHTDQIWWL